MIFTSLSRCSFTFLSLPLTIRSTYHLVSCSVIGCWLFVSLIRNNYFLFGLNVICRLRLVAGHAIYQLHHSLRGCIHAKNQQGNDSQRNQYNNRSLLKLAPCRPANFMYEFVIRLLNVLSEFAHIRYIWYKK